MNGVEVDKIKPRLSFLDLEDDSEGFERFLAWACSHYPNTKLEAIFDRAVEGDLGPVRLESVWVGGIPESKRTGIDPNRIRVFSRRGPWNSAN